MKFKEGAVGGLSISLILIIAICIVASIGIAIYGLVLAFKASIILGIIALIIEPSPFLFGVLGIFGYNLPEVIQGLVDFPF